MPVPKQQLPGPLRAFEFFGVDLSWKGEGDEAIAHCPFCDRDGKLYINSETGQYKCHACQEAGNLYKFMRRVLELSDFDRAKGEAMSLDRNLPVDALEQWGVRFSFLSGDVLVPGFDSGGRVNQLYKYQYNPAEERFCLNMAKGTHHQLHGVPLFDPSKPDVFICEGFWDGVALWSTLARYKPEGGDVVPTDDPAESFLATSNVLAVPTCSTFSEAWCELLAEKRVILLYDNDHPNEAMNGRRAAGEGLRQAVEVMYSHGDPSGCSPAHPKEVMYLPWGADGGEYEPTLKHGYDLRDLLPPESEDAAAEVLWLLNKVCPVPSEWIASAKQKAKPSLEPLDCRTWDDLVKACRKGWYFHEGMDRALSVMLAASASVPIGLDQLWVKFVSPPSTGKTSLADGLIVARKYAVLKNINTGLMSGYKGPEEAGEQDFSIMAQIKDKAVIIKDGDTLLQADNFAKTMSELRDAFDRKAVTNYRNGVNRMYEGHSFVILLFGTSALRKLDQSELGQRFLDCVLMDGIDNTVERAIITHKKSRIRDLMANQSTLNGDGTEGKDTTTAKRLIGGYLIHLRQRIKYLVEEVKVSEECLDKIDHYASFVAMFRGRPSVVQTEEESRESSGRLFDQLSKLAYLLAVVLNRKEIDSEVMRRVRCTALDSARGKTLMLARGIYRAGEEGADSQGLSVLTALPNQECRNLLLYMKKVGLVELTQPKGNKVGLGAQKTRWLLNPEVSVIYSEVDAEYIQANEPKKKEEVPSAPTETHKAGTAARTGPKRGGGKSSRS